MIFPCDKCGLCCKHINLIAQLKQFDSGNGRCIHLNEENLCEIYSNRPDICNVLKMYDLKFKRYFSKDEYIKINLKVCEELKKKLKSTI